MWVVYYEGSVRSRAVAVDNFESMSVISLRIPYESFVIPLWVPYESLMNPLWVPYESVDLTNNNQYIATETLQKKLMFLGGIPNRFEASYGRTHQQGWMRLARKGKDLLAYTWITVRIYTCSNNN